MLWKARGLARILVSEGETSLVLKPSVVESSGFSEVLVSEGETSRVLKPSVVESSGFSEDTCQ